MVKKIDLHIHTVCSDGALTPKEVIDEAVKNGVSVIAIADHDTIEAYNDDLFEYAKNKNIQIINAVEISTKAKKCGVHVLGYNFDMDDKEFRDGLSSLRNSRHDYLFNVASKIKELGYTINTEELDKVDAVTKAHIASDVVNNEKNYKLLMDNFDHIPSRGEFIETVMNEGCPAYVEKKTVTPKQAADMIRKAGGKAVLAHPVAYTYEDNLSEEDILEIVKEMNPDGIEAYYIYFNRENKKINDIEKWKNFTKNNNLFYTIGSDFHIKSSTGLEIGLDPKEFSLSEKEIEEIISNLV